MATRLTLEQIGEVERLHAPPSDWDYEENGERDTKRNAHVRALCEEVRQLRVQYADARTLCEIAQQAERESAAREWDAKQALVGLRDAARALYREAYGPSRAIRDVTALCDRLGDRLDGLSALAGQVRARVLREAADHMPGFDGAETAKTWLRACADEEGA